MQRLIFQNLQVAGAIISTKMEGSMRDQLRWTLIYILGLFVLGCWLGSGVEG